MRLTAFALLATGAAGVDEDLSRPVLTQAFVDHINTFPKSWKAHLNPQFVGLTFGDAQKMCGTIMKGDPRYREALEEKIDDGRNAYVPAEFDVRTNWPECADVSGHIRDQASCGSCWAFGSTEAFNDRRCIANGHHELLSVEDTTSNCGFFSCFSEGCNGGQPGQAWHWFTTHGVVTGGDYGDIGSGDSCAPYSIAPCGKDGCSEGPTPHLGSKCSEAGYGVAYKNDKVFAGTSYSLKSVQKIQEDMVQYGSATAAFTVYEDFYSYQTGVYRHVSGKSVGGHAIKFVGWGTDNGDDYWTINNSWGSGWAESGSFRILRGVNECGIEGQVSAGTAGSDAIV